MQDDRSFIPGINTHETVILNCFGGMSNAGITAALASLEAVKEIGLDKTCIGCLSALSIDLEPAFLKIWVTRKVVTVDGCEDECSRRIVERYGIKPTRSINLVRDIGMTKKSFHDDIGTEIRPLMDYIDDAEVKRAKDLIVRAVMDALVSKRSEGNP